MRHAGEEEGLSTATQLRDEERWKADIASRRHEEDSLGSLKTPEQRGLLEKPLRFASCQTS